jgi:hypothetical protein
LSYCRNGSNATAAIAIASGGAA